MQYALCGGSPAKPFHATQLCAAACGAFFAAYTNPNCKGTICKLADFWRVMTGSPAAHISRILVADFSCKFLSFVRCKIKEEIIPTLVKRKDSIRMFCM